jgi:hypothetical protein
LCLLTPVKDPVLRKVMRRFRESQLDGMRDLVAAHTKGPR